MSSKRSRNLWGYLALTVMLFLAVAFSLRVLWQGGAVGNRYDWSFTFYDWHRPLASSIWSWDTSGTGGPIGPNFGWFPNLLLAGVGSGLSLPVTPTLILWVTVLLTLAGLGMAYLLRRRGFPWVVAALASLLYALSPTILIRIIVGFTSYLWAYALAPWWLASWWGLKETPYPRRTALKAALLYALATAQQQFAVMLLLVMAVDLLVGRRDRFAQRRKLFALAASLALAALLHLPWLWLSLQSGAGSLSAMNEAGSSLGLISALPHDLTRTLLGIDHHVTAPLVEQLLPQRSFLLAGLLLLTLCFVGVLTRRREARVAVIILGLSWPLALGPVGVTAPLYRWIYTTLPFSNLFREVYHWAALTSLFLVIGVAYGWRWLSGSGKSKVGTVLATVVLLGTLGFIKPLPQSNFFGYLTPQKTAAPYAGLHLTEEQALNRGRSFFLPSLGFIRGTEYPGIGAANTDIPALSTNRPQLPSQSSALDLPSAAYGLRNALLTSWYQLPGAPTDARGYLRALGVSEVINRPRLESMFTATYNLPTEQEHLKRRWQRQDFDRLADQQPALRQVEQRPAWTRYELVDAPGLASLIKNPAVAAFDWTAANQDYDAVFYLEDLNNEDRAQVDAFPATTTPLDWMAAQWQAHNHLSDLKVNAAAAPELGWSRPSTVWWRAAGLAQAREPYLYTTSDLPLQGSFELPAPETYKILAKLWRSAGSSAVELRVNNESKQLPTNGGGGPGRFEWVEWGEITLTNPNTKVEISGRGETGVAQLLTIPATAYRAGQDAWKARSITPYRPPQGKITIRRITPTRFRVELETDREGWIIVREGYDSRWRLKLDGHEYRPVRVNGYAMAFKVPGGTYQGQLVYPPQTIYTALQAIALIALAATAGIALGRPRSPRSSHPPIDLSAD